MTILHSSAINKPVKTPYIDYLRAGIGRCALIFLLVMFLFSSPASATWWNESWGYKMPVFINNTGNATVLTNYQVNLNVTYNTNMQADFDDIRIVNDTSGTAVPYLIESKVNSSYANVWFNASSIPASVWTNSTYYLYYGNAVVSDGGSGTNTFPLFDDFEDGIQTSWTDKLGTWSETGGIRKQTSTTAQNQKYSYKTLTGLSEYIVHTKFYVPAAFGTGGGGVLLEDGVTISNGALYDNVAPTTKVNILQDIVAWGTSGLTGITMTTGTWYHIEGYRGSASQKVRAWNLSASIPNWQATATFVSQANTRVGLYGGYNNEIWFDDFYVRKYIANEPTTTLGTQANIIISGFSNNYTSNSSLLFSIPTTSTILFNISTIGGEYSPDYYSWFLNGVNQSNNATNIVLTISEAGINNITATAYNSTVGASQSVTWLITLPFSLLTPANNSVLTKSYPPLTSNIYFSWSTVGYPYYNLMVAKDSSFNLPVSDLFSTTPHQTISLPAGNYWWKVQSYNPNTLIYGGWSPTFNFTLTDNVSTTGTGIHGVVYKLVNGVPTPINGANVYIYNNQSTYTNMVTTGSNGYYLFTGLTNSTTYVIRATKTDEYDDSAVYYVTTGLGTTPIQNILMQTCTVNYNCYVNIIKMRFGLRYLNGSEIPDVLATVYKSGELIATDAGTTGSDGNVVFGLLRTQKYHVVFTLNSVQIGTWDGYPSDAINIEISSGVTITPITPDTNATYINASQHGTYAWGLDYFTGTNLTSSIGLGIKGQGLVTSIILLFLISFGGTAAGIVIAFMLSVLGIMSYKFVIILAIFSAAWYVIKREFT